MPDAPLYRWPDRAAFGRAVPKARFYEHAAITPALRQKIVRGVERITWAFALAERTIGLRGAAAVPEIQVFTVTLKGNDIDDDVLHAIDAAVPQPIIFELQRPDAAGVRMTAAYKQLGPKKPRVASYASTPWLASGTPRVPTPPAVDLTSLYRALLVPLLPVAARPGESLSEVIARIEDVRTLDRRIATLERRARREKQFNRQVDLRRELRARQAERESLLAGPPPMRSLSERSEST